MDFKKKYLKYKFKYINLKQNGSGKFDNLKNNPMTVYKKVDDDIKSYVNEKTKLNRVVKDNLAYFKKVDDDDDDDDVKLSDEETKLNRVIEEYFPRMKDSIHKIKQMITYYKNKPLPSRRETYFNNNYYVVNHSNKKIYHNFNKDNEFLKDIDEKTRIALFRIYPYYKNLEIELDYIDKLFKQSREERIININDIAKNNLLYHTESFELQTDRINDWVTLQKAKKVQEICKIIRDNINHIKFDTFLKGLQNSFKNFLKKIKEPKKDYIIIIADTNTKKSNYWCVLLIMNYINENKLKQPFDILANTRDALLLYNNEILKNIEYVIFDDCSYSGNQLSGHINRQKFKHDDEITRDKVPVVKDRFLALEKFKYKHTNTFNYFLNIADVNIKPEINVVICAITEIAINTLSNHIKRDNIFTDQIINSLGDIFKDKISETREIFETYFMKPFPYTKTITFFDHKFPDYYSIIYNFVPLGIISRIYKDGDEITDNKSYIIKENVFKKQYPYESVKGMHDNNIYYYPFIKITNLEEEFDNINYGHLIKPIYKRQDYKLPDSIIVDSQLKYDKQHFH